MNNMAENNPSILNDMLQPLGSLTPQAASEFADLKLPDAVQDRIALLAEKNNQGTISDAEFEEYETYVRYGNVLSVMKAKAKKVAADNV